MLFLRLSAIFIAMTLWSGHALCGGSLPLNDVMEVAKQNPALVKEINDALNHYNLNAKEVTCVGARLGSHWTRLGGARTLPFECPIGKKTLHIDGKVEFLNVNGEIIKGGLDNPDVFDQAQKLKETDLRWEWN
jgi:hypothetical protein